MLFQPRDHRRRFFKENDLKPRQRFCQTSPHRRDSLAVVLEDYDDVIYGMHLSRSHRTQNKMVGATLSGRLCPLFTAVLGSIEVELPHRPASVTLILTASPAHALAKFSPHRPRRQGDCM